MIISPKTIIILPLKEKSCCRFTIRNHRIKGIVKLFWGRIKTIFLIKVFNCAQKVYIYKKLLKKHNERQAVFNVRTKSLYIINKV